jgi:hypothetical protein
MDSATTTAPFSLGTLPLHYRILLYVPITLITLLAVWVATTRPYTPGSDLGYNLGLVGSCMMASLLLYPLRKHWRLLDSFGSLRAWFAVHIVFGILGPILVLFHSTFDLRSTNAKVAFWSMVVVALSGILGRFVFTKLYDGLELKKRTLRQSEKFLTQCAANAKDTLDLVPDVKAALDEYNKQMFASRKFSWSRMLTFFSIGIKGQHIIKHARTQIGEVLLEKSKTQQWPRSRFLAEKKVFESIIVDYVNAINLTARYYHWERVLAWWQLAHVPLAYILLFTAIVHVIAVHMY